MFDVGTSLGLLASAEQEEFLEAVKKQSIGRPFVVRPSKDLIGKFTNEICPPFIFFLFSLIYSFKRT